MGAVVVTHSRPDLAEVLAGRLSQLIDAAHVVVVANLASCRPHGLPADCKLVVNDVPQGYGANLNRGMRELPPALPFVLLCNDDVHIGAGALRSLVAALHHGPHLALVAPLLVDSQGRALPACHPFPSIATEIARLLMGPAELLHFVTSLTTRLNRGRPTWPVGAVLLARSNALCDVGNFDEDYFLYSEELDLARRLLDRGWGLAIDERATAVHLGHASTSDDAKRYELIYGWSRQLYIAKHWPGWKRRALWSCLAPVYLWSAGYATVVDLARRHHHAVAILKVKWRQRPFAHRDPAAITKDGPTDSHWSARPSGRVRRR